MARIEYLHPPVKNKTDFYHGLLAKYPVGSAIHDEHWYAVGRDYGGYWYVNMDGIPLAPDFAHPDLTYSTFSHIGVHFNSEESELNYLAVTAIPEPTTLALLGLGGLLALRRRRR